MNSDAHTQTEAAKQWDVLLRNPHYDFSMAERRKFADERLALVARLDQLTEALEALADCHEEWKYCPVCNYAEPHTSGHDSECILGAVLAAAGSSAAETESPLRVAKATKERVGVPIAHLLTGPHTSAPAVAGSSANPEESERKTLFSVSYKVLSHEHVDDEFARLVTKCVGYPTHAIHPAEWEFALIVPRSELAQWPLGSMVLLGITSSAAEDTQP